MDGSPAVLKKRSDDLGFKDAGYGFLDVILIAVVLYSEGNFRGDIVKAHSRIGTSNVSSEQVRCVGIDAC
jgi:hypothetical protein